jgi:transcriptional regulator with XRE-family HTH domain
MSALSPKFIQWLESQMQEKGMRHADLAKRSGVTPGAISRIFSGERGIRVRTETLVGFAAALDVPVETVLMQAGIIPAPVSEGDAFIAELTSIARDIPERYRDAFLGIAKLFRRYKQTEE